MYPTKTTTVMNLHQISTATIVLFLGVAIATEANKRHNNNNIIRPHQQIMKVERSNGMFILRHSPAFSALKEEAVSAFKPQPTTAKAEEGSLKLSDFEDSWSPWSKCRKRCTQVRRRMCKSALSNCQSTILKEERPCTGDQCQSSALARTQRHKKQRAHQQGKSVVAQHRRRRRPGAKGGGRGGRGGGNRRRFRVLYEMQRFIYSPWSEWEDCKLASCRTLRQRYCMNPDICSNSIIQEVALCYTAGSDCEHRYRPQVLNESELMMNSSEEGEEAASEVIEQQQIALAVENTTSQNSFSEEEIVPLNEVTEGEPTSQSSTQAIDDQNCGIRDANVRSMLRIIGGRSARSRWPWMVAILNSHYQPYCGGTLIAPQYVVTAAHCVKQQELFVVAGEHNFHAKEGTEQLRNVTRTVKHELYDTLTVDYDLALLKLDRPLYIDEYVSPICLPAATDQMATKENGTILGWGKKKNHKRTGTKVLQVARVPIADTEDCKQVYQSYKITKNMVCAGFKEGGTDSCAGDSGGPLMFRRKEAPQQSTGNISRNKWYLYGITSFGEGCGKKGKYGIYAKVPNMVSWIRETVEKLQKSGN